MSKRSLDDLKPSAVFVEDAEAQASQLGDYSQNFNARYDFVGTRVRLQELPSH